MNWLTLPLGSHAPEVVNAMIEVPGGQANKYEYDKSLHVVRLDRPLYASVHYPGDYGFVPSTLASCQRTAGRPGPQRQQSTHGASSFL